MAGSVENRGNNRWRLTYPMGLNDNGKQIRVRKTVSAKNKTQAKKMLAEFISKVELENYNPSKNLRFNQLVAQWKDKYLTEECSPKTQEIYNSILDSHILPYFGKKHIDDIDPLFILQYLKNLTDAKSRQSESRGTGGLSAGTRQQHYFVLRSIFKHAVDWKLLDKNPMQSIRKPVIKRDPREPYNEKDIRTLFQSLKGEHFDKFVMIKFTLFTGMRRGEVSGTQWKDIDLDKGILNVQHALYYTKDKGYYLDDTKNESSKRVIQLPPSLVEDLKKLKNIQDKVRPPKEQQWKDGKYDFVFITGDEFKPYFPNYLSHWFRRFLKRKNLKHISFHDLRHTLATLLINQGVHAKVISNILGHSNISTTMNIYGYVFKEAEQNVANKIDETLAADTAFKKITEKK